MKKINVMLAMILLSITTLYASVMNITSITGSSNTNSNYPASNLIDGNLQTFWQTNTGSSSGYVEISLESESLIYGMEIENRLLAETQIDVQFNENGQWHSFASAGQKNAANTIFIDLSYEQIVCSALRLAITGQNLEYGNIAEIKITGEKAADIYYKIKPAAVTTDDRFQVMSEPDTMFDGNIHSYWETLAYYKKWKIPAKIQELLEDIRSNINLPLRFTSQVDIELGGGKTIDLVKVFLRDDSTGIITFKVLQGSKWVSLYEIKTPLRSGWYRITVPESLKNMDKVRVVLSGSGLTSGGIGEIEFWGKGGYKAVSYNYITEGIDLNGIEQLFFNLDKQENINLEVVTTGVEIQPIELLMNGFVLHTNNYLTIGANRVYKILVDAVYLWEDVNVLQAKGIEGNNDKLIGVRIRNNPDTGLQSIDGGRLFDGMLATPVDLNTETIISFDKVYEIEKLEIINRTGNSCGVELIYKGDYSSVTLTAHDEAGVAFLSGSKADGIRLTNNGNNPCEIRIYGSIAKNNTPSFRVLVPDQKERKHDFLFHFSRNEERLTNVKYITGYVDDVNAKVYVNGQLTEMKDHFFKISVESLNLIRGANNILTVQAVNESGSNIQEVVFFLKDNNLLIIDQPDKVVYTKDSQVVISGKTNSPGCYLKIQGQIVRFTSNKFSANASLAFGFNLVVIELYRNNSNELLKRVYRRFIRTGNFDIVIQEPKSNTITNSSSIIVKGILTKAVNVTITAAVGTSSYAVALSNMIFTSQAIPLVEGENWITVTARDADGNKVTKTVSVTRDTIAPVVSITSPSNGFVTNNGLVTVTGSITEAAAAAVLINGKAATISSNSFTGTIEFTGDGNHVITVEAQDAAGNESQAVSVTVVLDQTPPAAFAVIPGTIGWTADARPVIEFAAVDGLSGIDYYELSIDKAAKQRVTSPYQLPVLSDGERQIEVFAYDKAGNFKVGYAVIFIDTTPPAPPEGFTAIPGITTNKVIWKDRVSEIASYKIYRTPAFSSGAFKNIVRTETTLITGEYEDNETVVGQFYSYNISAIDYAGNIGALCDPQLIQTGRAEEPVSEAGGSVYFEDLKLDVKENTFDTGDTVVIQVQTEPRPENQFAEAVTPIYSVLRIDESNTVVEEDFSQPVKLEFNYDELVIPAGYDPSNLGVYWYNEALEVWERLPNVVVDYLNKSISVETTHFTDYQTMASNYSAPNLSEYDKYNPFGGYFAKNTESVSAQSGTVNLSCRDIELKGKDGFDLVIERSYSSGAAEAETRNPSTPVYYSFPAGWSINIASIETREEGKYLRLESGQEIKIDLKSGTTWEYHDGVHLSLNVIKIIDSKGKEVISEYHVTMKDGTVYKFWADGRIYDKTSPSGLLHIEYVIDAASKKINTITDTLDRIVTFSYSGNFISSIHVTMKNDINQYYNYTYGYANNQLSSVTDVLDRVTRYEYTVIMGKMGYTRKTIVSMKETKSYSDGTSKVAEYNIVDEYNDATNFDNIALINKIIYPTNGFVLFGYTINNTDRSDPYNYSWSKTEIHPQPERRTDEVYPLTTVYVFTQNDSYNHKNYRIVTTNYSKAGLVQDYEYTMEGTQCISITASKIKTSDKIIEQNYRGIFKKINSALYKITENISFFSLSSAYENKGTFITEQTIKKNDGNTNPDDDTIFETIKYVYNSKLQAVSYERHFRNGTEIYNIHNEYSDDGWGNPVSTVDSRTGLKTEYSYQKHGRIQNLVKTNTTTNVIPDPNDSSKSINDIVTTTYIYHNSSGIAVDPATLLASTHTGKPYVIRVTYNNGASVSKETIYDYYDDVSVDDGRIRSITEDNLMCTTYSYTNDNSPDPTNITITGVKDVENNSLIITNTFTFNSRGLLYTETSPSGLVTTYTYDAIDRPRTVNKSDESSTEIVYDDPLNKSIYTDENDNSSEFYFDEYGRLEKIKVLSGSNPETIYHYNSLGQIDTVTAPGTRVTSYTYDYMGRVKTVTYPYSNDGDTVLPFVKLEYDDSTNSVSITDEKNVKIAEEKNNWAGRLTDAKQYAVYNGQTEIYNWNFTYDQAGNMITTTDPGNNITTNSYNGIGKQLQSILPEISVYDTYPYSSLVNIAPTYSFVYDKYGNKTDDYGPIGNSPNNESIKENYRTTTIYDELNRPKQVEKRYTEATGIVNTMITKIKYDAAGNKIRVMERTGNNTWRTFIYDYDVAGRLIAEWVPAEPDVDGNVWNITHYEYDKKGNKTAQIDPRGHLGYDDETRTYTNNPLYTTRYQYDAFDRLVATILPDNTNSAAIDTYDDNPRYSIAYNESGQKVLETDPDRVSKGFTYTPRGFLYQEKLIAANGQETILATYVYNEKGQKISVTDNASNTTRYEYDSLSRLRKTIFPGNIIEEYKYDFHGNLIEATDGRGVKRLTKYNNIGLVTEETISGNGKSTTTSYCYDPAGNQVTMTKPNGLTYQTTYDEQNRVKTTIDPRGNSYVNTYDYLGNIKQKIDPMGTLWNYTYAVDNSLTQLIASRTTSNRPLQYTSSYSYNKAGMMTGVTDNDNSINYSINHLGRVTAVSTTLDVLRPIDQKNYTISYQYTDGGKLSSITYPDAIQPIVYNYDSNGMLSGITGFVSNITYDSRLNLKSYKTVNNITQAFTYDSRNRLKESLATNQNVAASAGSLSSYQQNSLLYQNYTYDPSNNITSINNKSFGYDEKSQIVSSVIPELILEKTATPGDPGAVSKDIRGDRGLNFGIDPTAEIKVDYQSNSIGVAFSPAAQVKRIEIVPDENHVTHRIENNRLDIYSSSDNLSFTLINKNEYSYSKDELTGVITIELNDRKTMAILKLHVLFDERDFNDNPIDYTTFLNQLSKILKVYQQGDRVDEYYNYDANGNRMRKDVSVVRMFSGNHLYYKDSEWLLSDGDYAYSYDNAGNMTGKGNWIQVGGVPRAVNSLEGMAYLNQIANANYLITNSERIEFVDSGDEIIYWEYSFDLLNRLTMVRKNTNIVAEYGYSPDGIRTWKLVDGVKAHYVYEGDNLIFEKDLREGSVKNYVYGFGKHLARVDGLFGSTASKTYYYVCDQVGSVRAVTDDVGSKIWDGEYSAFGELIAEKKIDLNFDDNQRFGGKPYEVEVELYYFNARWYEPATGRFISKDSELDGLNWYVYSSNDPVTNIDPTGNETINLFGSGESKEYYEDIYKNQTDNYTKPTDQYDIMNIPNPFAAKEKIEEQKKILDVLSDIYFPDSKEPGLATAMGMKNPVYTVGVGVSGTTMSMSIAYSAGMYYIPDKDTLAYTTALLNSNSPDPLTAFVATYYLAKHTVKSGFYTTSATAGLGTIIVNPASIKDIKQAVSISGGMQFGAFDGLDNFKGNYSEEGGSISTPGFLMNGLIGLGFEYDENRNLSGQSIGKTIGLGLSFGVNLEVHKRWGVTFISN